METLETDYAKLPFADNDKYSAFRVVCKVLLKSVRKEDTESLGVLFVYSIQLLTLSTIQSARASTPSPVRADTKRILMSGLRILAYSTTFSVSKSK